MGRTYVSWEDPARDWNAETRELAAVPPEMTTTAGDVCTGITSISMYNRLAFNSSIRNVVSCHSYGVELWLFGTAVMNSRYFWGTRVQ